MPSSRITSLLEGLQFTPPSSARTKGDDTRYYVYTFLVRISTFSFWFSVWWDMPTSAFFHSYQIRMCSTWYVYQHFLLDFPFVEIYLHLLFTLGCSFSAWIDNSKTKWNRQTRQNQGRTGTSRAAVYVDVRPCFRHLLLFLLDFVPHTWQFVVYISFHLCYLYRSVQYRYLSTVCA